jgi:membrane-associated phospholipid phosphatase
VTIATAAGLTCVHHRHVPLFGHPAADTGACVAMVLATLGTGVTRIIADRHYTTDVLVGAAIGFGSGYGLPWLLHYRARSAEAPDGASVALLPFASPEALGIGVFGRL